jgi:hypothetical protein
VHITLFLKAHASSVGSNVSFVGSNFSHNSAAFHGGGIMCIFGLAYIADTVIADNMCASLAGCCTTCHVNHVTAVQWPESPVTRSALILCGIMLSLKT